MTGGRRRVAVIGGGWAGLAAAVEAVSRGCAVTVYEMAPQPGGRARTSPQAAGGLDNGQHILLGAYAQTLELMRRVGINPAQVLLRCPLSLEGPDGRGLRLPPGAPALAFARGVLSCRSWPLQARLALLARAAGWAARGFRCAAGTTVTQLAHGLPAAVKDDLIDPLCVAALNTPSAQADAAVFLRVLQDGLFSGPGSADLLLPRQPLHALLPGPATRWLQAHGAELCMRRRVTALAADGSWRVDGVPADAVVLACSATEAARLARDIAPAWSAQAQALHYQPIITAYLEAPGARLPTPMVALPAAPVGPAQFAFDHGALGLAPGRFAFVASGAQAWVAQGSQALAEAMLQQAEQAFPAGTWPRPPRVLQVVTEMRATFACTPGLARPVMRLATGLLAAGDYIAGRYPATLEGAVRSGLAAGAAAAAS